MESIFYMASLIAFGLGVTIVVFPKQFTKSKLMSDAAAIRKNRMIGIVISVIAAAALAVDFLYIK